MSGKNINKGAGGVNPVVAAVAGAIVGGVAAAGAMVLGDEKNRKKIREALSNVKNRTTDYVEDVKQAAQDKKEEIVEKMTEGKEKVLDKAESIKDVLAEE